MQQIVNPVISDLRAYEIQVAESSQRGKFFQSCVSDLGTSKAFSVKQRQVSEFPQNCKVLQTLVGDRCQAEVQIIKIAERLQLLQCFVADRIPVKVQ